MKFTDLKEGDFYVFATSKEVVSMKFTSGNTNSITFPACGLTKINKKYPVQKIKPDFIYQVTL